MRSSHLQRTIQIPSSLFYLIVAFIVPVIQTSFDDVIFSNGKIQNLYNKLECPRRNNGSDSAMIQVFIHVESIRDIASEAILDFYLVQRWNDSRLGQYDQEIKITGRILPNNVWYPDTYFLLVRSLLYSAEEQYFIIQKSGWIEYNRKVRLVTPCSPNVILFPFDVVRCNLVMSSFGYTDEEVQYQWEHGTEGVYIDPINNDVDHLGFYVLHTKFSNFTLQYASSNYSALETTVFLERKYTAYLLQVYTPAALIVILSWSIFWVNIHATPARASLGVTTVLTILTLATKSTSQNEKHVSGKLTALDIYIWACFVFVIFAMLEFALSDYTTYRKKEQDMIRKQQLVENSKLLSDDQFQSPTIQEENLANEPMLLNSPCSRFETPEILPLHSHNANFSTGLKEYLIENSSPPIKRTSAETAFGNRQTFDSSSRLKRRKTRKGICDYLSDGYLLNNSARVLFPIGFSIFNILYWATLYILVRSHKHSHEYQGSISTNNPT